MTNSSDRKRLVKSGDLVFNITVTQEVSKILGNTYGLYNYDRQGTNIAYEPLAHQVSVLKKNDATIEFRMIAPGLNRFLLLRGLPSTLKEGDAVSFSLFQNWTKDLDYSSEVNAEVFKTEDDMVWLLNGDVCYVIKK